jgi:hypothetical protein
MLWSERLFMRSIKNSLAGLVLAGILALAPTAALAHGGGGGGHFGGGGGHFGGFGGGHFGGGGRFGGDHFAGFARHSFAGHGFAQHQGTHFAFHEDHFHHGDHFRHGGHFFFGGDPFWYDYPYYGYDYAYYDYYGDNADDYYDGQPSVGQGNAIIAVQQELAQLGYYHGPVDGQIGPETETAIRWFQSVDKLSVTGHIDAPTLKALGLI